MTEIEMKFKFHSYEEALAFLEHARPVKHPAEIQTGALRPADVVGATIPVATTAPQPTNVVPIGAAPVQNPGTASIGQPMSSDAVTHAMVGQSMSAYLKRGEGRSAQGVVAILNEFGVSKVLEATPDKLPALKHAFDTR
jgi:hypothetical protein